MQHPSGATFCLFDLNVEPSRLFVGYSKQFKTHTKELLSSIKALTMAGHCIKANLWIYVVICIFAPFIILRIQFGGQGPRGEERVIHKPQSNKSVSETIEN